MYYQFRKTRNAYNKFPQTIDCQFCDPQKYCEKIIEESAHCYVVPNRVFYDQWEMSRVLEHYMVIPKRHVLHLKELNLEEQADLIRVIAQYEGNGYEIYARSQINVTRSVPHQHTHLIKTTHKPHRFLLFCRRPWILWLFG